MSLMWRCEPEIHMEKLKRCMAKGNARGLLFRVMTISAHHRIVFLVLSLMFSAACRQDMQDQPKMKPYRSSTFFRDGLSSRPPVEGTIPRGFLKTDTELFTGKKSNPQKGSAAQAGPTPGQSPAGPQPSNATPATSAAGALQGAAAYPDDVEAFPFPI